MKKNNNQSFILILLVICIILGGLYAAYMYIIAPKMDEHSRLTAANAALAVEEAELKQQLKIDQEAAEASAASEAELYMKVPAQRDIAPFIKQIEQFEGISNVAVSGVSFNNYDAVVSEQFSEQQSAEEAEQTNIVEQAEKKVDEKSGAETPTDGEATEEEVKPSTSIDYASLPNNIKLMTVSMTVSAMDESEILDFLQQVQKSTRLIRVDSIDYTVENQEQAETVTTEEVTVEQAYPVSATVQLTTFYEQGLATSE